MASDRNHEFSVTAVDVGASGGRVMVGTWCPHGTDGFELTEVHRFANGPIADGESLRWDIEHIVLEIRRGIARAADRFVIRGVGIDTWGVDYGLLDAMGRLIELPFHYRDARTQRLLPVLETQGALGALYETTGIATMAMNTLFQVTAELREEPQTCARVHRLLLMPDLIAYLLGAPMGCEASIASTTQLMESDAPRWSRPILDTFGIPHAWLCPICSEGRVAGGLSLDGIGASVPFVRVCEHDTASAVASTHLEDRTLFVSCGTWSLVGTAVTQAVRSGEAESFGMTNERGADGSTLLLKNCTGLWIAQQLRDELSEGGAPPSWNEIIASAEQAPAFACLIDTQDQLFTAPGPMSDRISSFARRTGQTAPRTGAAMFRCVFESLALQYLKSMRQIQHLTGVTFDRVRIIGGGARNRVICQTLATISHLRVLAGPYEATAIGNVLVQLVALGIFRTLEEAQRSTARYVDGATRYTAAEKEVSAPEIFERICDAAQRASLMR